MKIKKRYNKFKELSPEIQEMLIQKYFKEMENKKLARIFATIYCTKMGTNFDMGTAITRVTPIADHSWNITDGGVI